jgi:eukaryotic-like serine/threonine-protein kinase
MPSMGESSLLLGVGSTKPNNAKMPFGVISYGMAITVGDHIGDHEVISTLGSGGMGHVYQVRHMISHRVEAMKVLLPGRPATEEIAQRFLREIRLLASLDHPNIAVLHTAFRHEGELIMIMEFVEGQTLRAKLDTNSVMMGRSIDYIQQVLSGLAYAHTRGVIHRDIKPSNIMINRDDRVKLVDFGLAFPTLGSDVTRPGAILGSLHYMSPEQVMGEQLDARSDLYSVGVTLYQLITGRLPFDGTGEYAIASSHLRAMPTDPVAINPNIPPLLSEAVMKSLAKTPESRFQTAAEFLEALRAIRWDEATTLLIPARRTREPDEHTPAVHGSLSASDNSKKTSLGQRELESVSRELAFHIGPIARLVVNRAAKKAVNLDELYALVAKEIDAEESRKRFLATRRNLSST